MGSDGSRMISSILLVVLVCCYSSGFRTFKPKARRRNPLRMHVLPALLPEEYDPVAIDRYFNENPTLAFQRTGEIMSKLAWWMVECVGELVTPPFEKRCTYDDELEDSPSIHRVDISNTEYPPRLMDMVLGYNYMAIDGYGNEGKVEKSDKFSLLARCAAKLRQVLIGLGPSFIKIGQVHTFLSGTHN